MASPTPPEPSPADSETTGVLPVVAPAAPLAEEPGPTTDELRLSAGEHVLTAEQVRALAAPDPNPAAAPEPIPAEWATDRLTPGGAFLHALACACQWGGDAEGHGVDFDALAARQRQAILIAAGTERAPVEAKVWAGTWGAAGAGLALVFVTALLESLDVIPAVFGGAPWTTGVVAFLTVLLPALGSFLRSYLAQHTVRPADLAQGAPAPAPAGGSTPDASAAI